MQLSVFEMDIEPQELELLRAKVRKVVDEEVDKVRIYRLCGSCWKNVEVVGPGAMTRDPEVYVL